MILDRQKIGEILEVQQARDSDERGLQPALTLGCAYRQRLNGQAVVDTHVFCDSVAICENFSSCFRYLESVELREKPFVNEPRG